MGSFIAGAPPAIDAQAEEIKQYWVDNRGQLLVGALLQALGLPLFLVFVLALREALARGGDEGEFWGRIATAGAIVTVTLATLGGALGLSIVWMEGFAEQAGDDAVRAVWNAGTLPFVGASAALFSLVGAAAVAILRTRVLPRWTGWLGAVAAVVSLVSILGFVEPDLAMIGFLGFLLFALWVVTTSIAMLRGAPAANSTPAPLAS